MNYCPHCGNPLEKDTAYCPYCGKKFAKQETAQPGIARIQEELKDARINTIASSVVAGIGFGGGIRWAIYRAQQSITIFGQTIGPPAWPIPLFFILGIVSAIFAVKYSRKSEDLKKKL